MITIDLLRHDAAALADRSRLHARVEARRAYERQWRAVYRKTEHGRSVIRAANDKYQKSAKRAAWLKEWRKRPDVAAKRAARDLLRKQQGDPSLLRSKEKYWLSEKGKASARAWRKSPAGIAWSKGEKRKAWERAYAKSDKERARTRAKSKGDKQTGYNREYIRSERGKLMNQRRYHRRRSALRGVPSEFTKEQWGALQVAYGKRCAYCGEQKPLTQDHVRAIKNGGHDTIANVVPACKSCNSRKRDLSILEALRMFGVDADEFWARHEDAVDKVRSIT